MKNLSNKIVLTIIVIVTALLILALTPKRVQSDQIAELKHTEDQREIVHVPEDIDHAVVVAKTIALIETGGNLDCAKPGLSGERGCHQYLPSTWASYSKDVFGYVAEQTPENATFVTEEKIRQWKKEGLTDRQIFLIWNQGHPGQCKSGVNRYGVPYDSCKYADDALITLAKVIHMQ